MPSEHRLVAWDTIGRVPSTHHVRVVGGRALYEESSYRDDTPGTKVMLWRVQAGPTGLSTPRQRVDPDTPVELVRADGTVEPDPFSVLL